MSLSTTPAAPPPLTRPQLLRAVVLALVVLTALWGVFFWRVLTPTAEDRVIFNQQGDFVLHFYAPIAYQIERLQAGELPLWNPYNYAGEPSLANIQNGSFYPPRYLAALLAGPGHYTVQVYQVETALHYWLASLLMFAFVLARFRRVGLAILGGTLFAYRGYMTGYAMLQASTVATEAWLPLALLGVYLCMGRYRVGGALLAAIAVALMLLAGRPQAAFYLIVMVMAYLAYLAFETLQDGDSPRRVFIGFLTRALAIGGLGVALAAAQLLPMQEFANNSYRVIDQAYADKASGFSFAELSRLFLPGMPTEWSPLYIGVAPLLLVMGALFGKLHREAAFWAALLVLSMLLMFGANSIAYDSFYAYIPGFDLFRNQERIAALVTLALLMLALHTLAAGDGLLHPTFRRAVYAMGGVLLAGFLLLSVLVRANMLLPDGVETLNVLGFLALVAVLFVVWMALIPRLNTSIALALLLLLVVFDLFTVGTRSPNFVPDTPENYLQIDPALEPYTGITSDAIRWRVDGAAGLQGRGILFDVPDIYGLGAISLATPEQLYKLPVDRLWEVLAVRYVTAIDDPPPGVPLELLAYGRNPDGMEFRVFELQDPRPLAHLVYDYRHAEGSAEFARLMMADNRVNLREMAITLNPLPIELPVTRPDDAAISDFATPSPEHFHMTVTTSTNALLTLAVVNYPGWQATINGQPVDIVDVHAGLIGVPVSAGEGQVIEVRFVSNSTSIGIAISGLTLLIMLMVAGWRLLRRPAPSPPSIA